MSQDLYVHMLAWINLSAHLTYVVLSGWYGFTHCTLYFGQFEKFDKNINENFLYI